MLLCVKTDTHTQGNNGVSRRVLALVSEKKIKTLDHGEHKYVYIWKEEEKRVAYIVGEIDRGDDFLISIVAESCGWRPDGFGHVATIVPFV